MHPPPGPVSFCSEGDGRRRGPAQPAVTGPPAGSGELQAENCCRLVVGGVLGPAVAEQPRP